MCDLLPAGFTETTVSGIARPTAMEIAPDNSDAAVPGSEVAILDLDNLSTATNHNGALDSPTPVRDPFPLTNAWNFSSDGRTRVMFFVTNLDLAPGENTSAIVAQAQADANNAFPLTVEFAGKAPRFDWLTQVVVRLPHSLPSGQAVFLSVTFHGQTSNKARFQMR